ncbi:AMP-binding enzyme [Streptomyces flaveus]|uniref:AMP-binding enzyme n=1 Tax=Streptomyces flaveus TaxID=66370 RepID=UPI003326AD8B
MTGNLAAKYPERVRSLVVTGSMPVFYRPLAPLPEGTRRGRNARDVYYDGDGPSPAKMRELMARLEWYDADAIPEGTVKLRHEQSLAPEEMALAAVDPEDLTRHCALELPAFAVPRYIETVPSLPLTETGKVRKAALRERGVTAGTWDQARTAGRAAQA